MGTRGPIPGASVGVYSSKCKSGARALIPSDLLLISLQNHGLCSCGSLYSQSEYDLEAGKTFAVTLLFKTDRSDYTTRMSDYTTKMDFRKAFSVAPFHDPLWRVRLHNKDGFPKGPRATILQSQLIRHVIDLPRKT